MKKLKLNNWNFIKILRNKHYKIRVEFQFNRRYSLKFTWSRWNCSPSCSKWQSLTAAVRLGRFETIIPAVWLGSLDELDELHSILIKKLKVSVWSTSIRDHLFLFQVHLSNFFQLKGHNTSGLIRLNWSSGQLSNNFSNNIIYI